MSPLIITWADNSTQTDIFQSLGKSNEDSTQEELLAEIKFFTDKLCSALHLNKEHNALPILIRAIENKVEELTKEKQTLEGEVKKEMLRVHEELQQARDQLSKTEESNIDLEEELNRVLDYQEQERVEMQHRMRSIAGQVKAELEKAKQDKKMAEETLNTSLEKLCEETNLMNEHHEQSLLQLRQERDSLKRKLDEAYNTSKQEQDRLLNERNELERSFFDYKIKSVSEKEGLIDSQTRNLEMLERLKKEYETRDKQVDDIRQQCAENIEKLKHELEEIKLQEKDKNLEIERLKNKIHEYCNREVDAKEKLDTNQRIIGALKRDVLETRDRLESLAGIELEKREADENLEKLTLANKILSEKVDFLEGTKITLEAEAGELRNAIENARHSLTNAQKMNTESYKNPAIAAVAHLWMQERDEHRKLHQEVCSLSKELEDVKIENVELEESFRSVNEDLSNRLNTSDAERVQLKTKLQSLQENKINIEYEVERVKDNLNKSNQQLEIAASDRTGLQSIINQQSQEKDRLLDDLNQSFKEKAQKTKELENCLTELATSRDELYAVKDELVKNRKEEEKLRESLKLARVELDDLEDNVERMKQETDTANKNQSRLLDLEEELTVTQKKNTSLSRQVKMLQEERMRIEETSQLNNEKLEKDIAEILDAFEEYKSKTGSAPEKVQELKQGMTALQGTLHQIMNTNSDLSKSNAKLSQDITNLRNENEILSREREEYKHQLDNSMLDLSKDSVTDVLTQNMSLKEQLESSHKKIQRCEKLEHDNVILKNKLRKMRDMLRDKEDQLVNLNETVESKDDCDRENQSLRRQVSVLKQKLDKNKEANIMLKDKIRELNTSDRFLASTPNQSRSFSKEQELTDELDTVRKELENLKRCRNNLAADSRISFTPSQMSTSVLSASERCKTLELELSDMKDRYQILQTTHEAEQNKSHELSDALRNSIRILKSYIDRSGETKGTRMYELQNQLDEQRSQLISMSEQFSGLDVSQALTGSLSQFQTDHELESLASGSTVCLEPTDSQLI